MAFKKTGVVSKNERKIGLEVKKRLVERTLLSYDGLVMQEKDHSSQRSYQEMGALTPTQPALGKSPSCLQASVSSFFKEGLTPDVLKVSSLTLSSL